MQDIQEMEKSLYLSTQLGLYIQFKNVLTISSVVQLAEWLFPTPEDPGSNPAKSDFYKEHLLTVNFLIIGN